jgi:hypothetical protein
MIRTIERLLPATGEPKLLKDVKWADLSVARLQQRLKVQHGFHSDHSRGKTGGTCMQHHWGRTLSPPKLVEPTIGYLDRKARMKGGYSGCKAARLLQYERPLRCSTSAFHEGKLRRRWIMRHLRFQTASDTKDGYLARTVNGG